jgi:hypothetical protein
MIDQIFQFNDKLSRILEDSEVQLKDLIENGIDITELTSESRKQLEVDIKVNNS